MDPSILQLFTAEEVLKCLTEKAATGGLHVFTAKESANAFFLDGTIVAACKGLVEGEEVIRKILEWQDAHLIWQEGQPPAPGLKPLELNFPEVLARQRIAAKLEIGGKTPAQPKHETHPIISIPSRAASTGPMTLNKTKDMSKAFDHAAPLPPVEVKKQNLIPVTTLSKTTSMEVGSREDNSFEEALMRKHQLALVAVGETPPQRLRIIRSSNLVGRNPACDFTLNHGSISRQHCLLQIMERGLHVKDLSTTNGTKVNGIPLTEGYVSVGDKLTIGHLEFMVEKDEPAAGV